MTKTSRNPGLEQSAHDTNLLQLETTPNPLRIKLEYKRINFTYINYQNITASRTVDIIDIYMGATQWHPTPQWLMSDYDVDKKVMREFAMKDMTDIIEVELDSGGPFVSSSC